MTGRQEAGITRPDQPASRVIDHLGMRIEEFFLEDRQVGIIQVELEFYRAISDASAAAEQGKGLVEHGVKVAPHFPALLGQSPSPCDKTLARRAKEMTACPNPKRSVKTVRGHHNRNLAGAP